MEDWEEDSVVESCRSSVISDIDELEASLYGIIHHEVNEDVNESFSYAPTVVPVSVGEGFWRTKEDDVSVITEQDINNDKNEEFRKENEKCIDQKEKEVQFHERRGRKEKKKKGQSSVNKDLSESCKYDHTIEYDDSRYNVGCVNDYANKNIATTSLNTSNTDSGLSMPCRPEDSSPIVIDVPSSDEEKEVHPVNIVTQSRKESEEEVVVLDDSDSDIIIEMEKFHPRQNKRKTFSDDIQLNTVKFGKSRRSDLVTSPRFIESSDVQSYSPAPNTLSTPMKELDLSTICKSWTPEMIHFYEESWGGENWTLNEVLTSMSDQGWQLDVTDQFSALPDSSKDRRYFGNTKHWCTNCNRRGHSRNECPEQRRKKNCRRCGSANHSEYKCEEKICLSCGKETKYITRACRSCLSYLDNGTTCSICSVKGHTSKCCPDLWRRYHATVVPGHVVCPKKVLYKSSMNLYCCNCATKGHHVFQCKKKIFSDYVPHSPKVIKYDNPSSTRDTDRLAISENWDRRSVALESNSKETPKSRRKYVDKSGSRPEIPIKNGNPEAEKLEKTSKEYNNSTPCVTTIKPINSNKKKSKKKKRKDQQNINLNGSKISCVEQPTVSNEPDSFENSNQSMHTHQCMDKFLSKTTKFILSKKEYQMLKTKKGEEVLKYVSGTEANITITLLHTEQKMLVFIGTKRGVMRARKLMINILSNKEAWDKITESVTENGAVESKKCNEIKLPGVEVLSTPNMSNDLRVKISNQSQPSSRDVSCLPLPKPEDSQGPKNNVMKTKKRKSKILQELQKKKIWDPQAKSTIQTAARNILKRGEDINPTKVKLFSLWALRSYGSVINGTIRYKLRTLSRVKDNCNSIEFLKKNLRSILKWNSH